MIGTFSNIKRFSIEKIRIVLLCALIVSMFLALNCSAEEDWSSTRKSLMVLIEQNELARSQNILEQSLKSNTSRPANVVADQERLLALVLAARGVEADEHYRAFRFSGQDIVVGVVVALLLGSVMLILIKHGAKRPRFVDTAERWVDQNKQQAADDSLRQLSSMFWSMIVFALLGGGLLILVFGLIHLISFLDNRQNDDSPALAYYKEAAEKLESAYQLEGREKPQSNYEALLLFADFLAQSGNRERADRVVLLKQTLENREKMKRRALQ